MICNSYISCLYGNSKEFGKICKLFMLQKQSTESGLVLGTVPSSKTAHFSLTPFWNSPSSCCWRPRKVESSTLRQPQHSSEIQPPVTGVHRLWLESNTEPGHNGCHQESRETMQGQSWAGFCRKPLVLLNSEPWDSITY